MAPDALTVVLLSTLMLVASISSVPPNPSRLPTISTFDLPALMISELIEERAVDNESEMPSRAAAVVVNWIPPDPLSWTFNVSKPLGSARLITAVVESFQHRY